MLREERRQLRRELTRLAGDLEQPAVSNMATDGLTPADRLVFQAGANR